MGLLGVALGAFGAHSLDKTLKAFNTVEIWKTASQYHLIHAVVLLVLATLRPVPTVAWSLILFGVIGFSGSLYAYAVSGTHWLVFVTPLGGVLMMAGWVALVFRKMTNDQCLMSNV